MKNLNFIVNRICANTPPCSFRGASRVLGLVLVLLTFGVGNTWGATIPFTESFASSTGSNSGFGSASGDGNGTFATDNTGWTTANAYGANGAAKFGGSKSGKAGSATTPSLSVTSGSSYTLSFKAAPWASETTTMTVTISGGKINNSTTATTTTMTTGQWNSYQYTIVANSTSMTVAFTASKNRFFLDDVSITAASGSTPQPTLYTVTYALNGGTGTTPTEASKASGATFSLHNGTTGITAPSGKIFSQWKDQDNQECNFDSTMGECLYRYLQP